MSGKLRIAAAAALIAAVGAAGACASTDSNNDTQMNADTGAASAPAASPQESTAPPAQSTQTEYTDAQLQAFVAAAREIDPLAETLATATPEQRTQTVTQIRAILQRNNLDQATYNAIAQRAQSDPAFMARINALAAPTTEPPSASPQ